MKAKYVRVRSPKGKNNITSKYTIAAKTTMLDGLYEATSTDVVSTDMRPSLPCPGGGMFAVSYGDYIYFTNGVYSSYSEIGYIYRYNPATGEIVNKATLAIPRRYSGMCAADGKIYIAGGMISGNPRTDSIEVFDMATETLSTSSIKLPVVSYRHTIHVIGTYMYVIGGDLNPYGMYVCEMTGGVWTNLGSDIFSEQMIYTTTLCDGVNTIWTTYQGSGASVMMKIIVSGIHVYIGAYSGALERLGSFVSKSHFLFNGKFYIMADDDTVKVFDPTTASVVTGTVLQTATKLFSHTSGGLVYHNGYAYMLGSMIDGGTKIERLDMTSGTAMESMVYSYPEGLPISTRYVSLDDKIYIIGGCYGQATKNIYIFDATNSTYKKSSLQLNQDRCDHALFVIDKKIYIVGGSSSPTTAEVFDTEAGTITPCFNAIPNGRVSSSGTSYNGIGYVIGGMNDSEIAISNDKFILKFDPTTEVWTETGIDKLAAFVSYLGGNRPVLYTTGGYIGIVPSSQDYGLAVIKVPDITLMTADTTRPYFGDYTQGATAININGVLISLGTYQYVYLMSVAIPEGYKDMGNPKYGTNFYEYGQGGALLYTGDKLYILHGAGATVYDTTTLTMPSYTPAVSGEVISKVLEKFTLNIKKPIDLVEKARIESISTPIYGMDMDPLSPGYKWDLDISDGITGTTTDDTNRGAFVIINKTTLDGETIPAEALARASEAGFKATDVSIFISKRIWMDNSSATGIDETTLRDQGYLFTTISALVPPSVPS